MLRLRRPSLPFLAALALAACASDVEVGDWTITVDTLNGGAGPVRVVNTPPAGDADPITWLFEEDLRIGGQVEGAMTFGSIAQIAVDAQGRVAALDFTAKEFRIFAPDGRQLHAFGEGEGPGELSGGFGVLAEGDHFLVADYGNARITAFTADSGFVTAYPARFYSYGSQGWDAVVDTAGRIHMFSSGPAPGGAGGQFLIRIYDGQMTQVDSVFHRTYEEMDRVHGGRASWVVPMGRGTMYLYVPFYAMPYELLDRTGAIWYAEAPLVYRLKRYVPGGDTLRIVEMGRSARPVPPAARDSAIDDLRGKLAEQGLDTDLDWSLIPEFYATIHELSLSDEGDLWVRTTPENESPTRYDVLDPDGRYRGTAEIPARVKRNVEPVVRGDRFWAVVAGDLDEEAIVGGRLVEAAPET
jgi:hypothetical protein